MNVLYFAIVAAVAGFIPMPYEGYVVIKIIVTGACLITALNLTQKQKKVIHWGLQSQYWLYGIAILYNPIFPIYLNRPLWIGIDIFVATVLFTLVSEQKKEPIDHSDHSGDVIEPMADVSTQENEARQEPKEVDPRKGDDYMKNMVIYSLIGIVLILMTVMVMQK